MSSGKRGRPSKQAALHDYFDEGARPGRYVCRRCDKDFAQSAAYGHITDIMTNRCKRSKSSLREQTIQSDDLHELHQDDWSSFLIDAGWPDAVHRHGGQDLRGRTAQVIVSSLTLFVTVND